MSAEPSRLVSITASQRINRVAWLCALALLFEGYDIASIGYAIPSLVDAWKVQPSVFTQVLTAGNVGLLLGSIVAGWLGDRLGRKPVLMGCIFLFGAFSLMSASAGSPSSLSGMRFLTGLGLGGTLPTVLALAADVAPSTGPERFVILVNVGGADRILCGRIVGNLVGSHIRMAGDLCCGRHAATLPFATT